MLRRAVLTGAGSAALLGSSTRAAQADTLDEVKKRGTLVVGMEAAYVPYEFFKDGKIIGYDPDIIEHFVGKLGVKAQLVDTAWNGIIPALYAKKFDVIISAMTITKERAEKVLFSMPYADASNVDPAARRRGSDQGRGRSVRQDHRRADRQRRGRHHQDLRGQAEGQRQAGLLGREAGPSTIPRRTRTCSTSASTRWSIRGPP